MYYEEQTINGRLMFRTHPKGEWKLVVNEYCQPRDVAPAPLWLLVFDDADKPSAKYDSYENAICQYDRACEMGWNCYLFVTEKRHDTRSK